MMLSIYIYINRYVYIHIDRSIDRRVDRSIHTYGEIRIVLSSRYFDLQDQSELRIGLAILIKTKLRDFVDLVTSALECLSNSLA